jgi:hypothetical protein
MALDIQGTANPSSTGDEKSQAETAFRRDLSKEAPDAVATSAVLVLPAMAKAGLSLSYFVLSIVTGSIALLLICLVWMGSMVGNDVTQAYRQVLDPGRLGSEFYTLGRLEALVRDFATARDDPTWTMSAEAARNEADLYKLLDVLPSVTAAQKATIGRCNPLPADPDRKAELAGCIGVLEHVRQAALEAASGANNAQVAGEAMDKLLAHRQAFMNFWLQAAQLILLNLLLPLLTALFGYIFGTQQAQRSA